MEFEALMKTPMNLMPHFTDKKCLSLKMKLNVVDFLIYVTIAMVIEFRRDNISLFQIFLGACLRLSQSVSCYRGH